MARIVKTKQEVILADYSNTVILTDYILRWLSLGLYRIIYGSEKDGSGHLGVFIFFRFLLCFLRLRMPSTEIIAFAKA